MTKYEMLMSLSDLAVIKARRFAQMKESDMARYWNNVAHEYRARALALRCADVKKEGVKFLTNGDFLQGKKGDIFILEKEEGKQ